MADRLHGLDSAPAIRVAMEGWGADDAHLALFDALTSREPVYNWSVRSLPDMVQTEGYARAAWPGAPELRDRVVATRIATGALLERMGVRQCHFIAQGVLLGESPVMAEQVKHLARLAALGKITVRLVSDGDREYLPYLARSYDLRRAGSHDVAQNASEFVDCPVGVMESTLRAASGVAWSVEQTREWLDERVPLAA